uniref:NADH-ubiquinone oxidoreductase chain 6 n=1 Tax=Allacta australiensis TaxID=2093427 RepID=A0A2P1H6P8_9NEOP|nr:NADH dehydrogenase subunit 6 [Allacta australiensis]
MMLNMMLITSMIFTQINHPMTMGLMLLIQTTMVSMYSGLMSQSFWFSYILFLMFMGGMLVLFIYLTSIASNEMFNMSTKVIIFSIMTMIILIILFSMNKLSNTQNQEMINFLMLKNPLINSLTKLYNQPTGIITILLASYLFLTLIAVVKITNIFMGPLRQMN